MAERWFFTLNGARVDVDADDVDPTHTTLSQWLRRNGRTGTKEGCAEGDCGACTVLVSDLDSAGKPAWRGVNACIALLPSVAGREVVTVEGLARSPGALHPVQAAMVKHYGSQCGYCTPGFVMSMAEGYERSDVTAERSDAICAQLDGNICRCTGYRPIRDAMVDALRCRDQTGDSAPSLVGIGSKARRPVTAPVMDALDVSSAGARFVRPTSLDALLRLRAEHPAARLLGGATEIGVELRKRQVSLPMLIATDGVDELRKIEETPDAWIVGGAATLTALDEVIAPAVTAQSAPAAAGIARMLRVFASRPIRNRATLAGNVVTASPIGDMPPVLLALGAEVVLVSQARGERRVGIDAFFTGYRKTAMAPDEIVRAIVIPKGHPSSTSAGGRTRFDTLKVSKRRDLDISIVAAAFCVQLDANDVVTAARLAYGGVAATPVRAKRAEAALVGKKAAAPVDDVLAILEAEFAPIDDVRAKKDYRRGLAASTFERFWLGAVAGKALGGLGGDEVHSDPAFTEEPAWPGEIRSRALAHDSARGHVTGGAMYVDDTAQRRPMLDVWPVTVPHARARILKRDATTARAMPGVRAVLFSEDIPGENDVGAVRKDEILLAGPDGAETKFHGHPVALVVADTVEQARAAARAVVVEVEPLPAIIGIPAALAAQSFHTEPHVIARGDCAAALAQAKHTLKGTLAIGGQEHFYLETHAAFAERGEDDEMQVSSSTQHPSEVQAVVSHVLHLPRNKVVVTSPRMGGGFGGKETQGNTWAALAALAAWHTHQPVRVMLDRDVDMELTGKRHPFHATFEVGFDDDGRVTALSVQLVSDGGWALDLSESILDRALFHLDNAYAFDNVRLEGRVAKTNVTSHTAFRGFGGPQGMLVVEDVMARVAGRLGVDPAKVRARNFYEAKSSTQTTPYGQLVDDHRINGMWSALEKSAELDARRAAIEGFNAGSAHVKRGLAITPVKFGISFTASFLNQAGALVHIYRDGTIQVNHGGTEMGQGLNSKVLGIVMRELGVQADHVRVMKTTTDKVPNTSATAASSGADLNGAAVKAACESLRTRLQPVAAALLEKKFQVPVNPDDIAFLNGWVRGGASSVAGAQVSFADVVEAAYMRQTSLSSTGYYRTPDIGYDKKAGRGKPFHYFAYGVCAAEVEVDGFTGMKRVRRVDILHDVGDSLNPAIDRGQVEGAFIQGMGWLTAEELAWTPDGRLLTHSASTYQVPTFSDAPAVFKVALLEHAPQHNVVHGSKAVGEPPLMLAIAVREALRDAVSAFGADASTASTDVELPSPVTHEVLFHAIQRRRGGAQRERKAAE
jgi:xanthine dehydrogenase molybdopterin binding subunit/xanthine dehydrogenase small subunit